MAVKMRLRREGKKKQPTYRIVVANDRSPRDGRFLEDLGYYHPLAEPSSIKLDHDRALTWLRHGAQPTQQVRNLLRIEGVWEAFRPGESDQAVQRRERRAERAARKGPAAERASTVSSEGGAGAQDSATAGGPEAATPGEAAGDTTASEEVASEAESGEESQA